MAKRKSDTEEITDTAQVDVKEQQEHEVKNNIDAPFDGLVEGNNPTGIPEDEGDKSQEESVELSDEVKKILRQYPNEQELYIDNCGGVFMKWSQPALVKNAILYKNPYYNK
jgi:hypothetical protein